MNNQKNIEKEKYVELELSAVKIKQFNKQPIMESFLEISKDGKWAMHKTIITDIKPISYYEKVLGNLEIKEE